jgi:hypothetical protein
VLITGYTVSIKIIDQDSKVVVLTGLNYLDNPGHQIGKPRLSLHRHIVWLLRLDQTWRAWIGLRATAQALISMITDWVIKARVVSKSPVKEFS